MQAKDISDAVMLAALEATRGLNGAPAWSSLFDVQAHMGNVPPKIVLSKIRSMIKRNLLQGCGCGCRGDFSLWDASRVTRHPIGNGAHAGG
jgi:hypothetical protein